MATALFDPDPESAQTLRPRRGRDSGPLLVFTSRVHASSFTRRHWLKTLTAAGCALPLAQTWARRPANVRSFHVCLSPALVESDPELVEIVRSAGVGTVWLAGFFYGYQPFPEAQLRRAQKLLARAGLDAQLVTVPLGHPGDSLGTKDGDFPLTPPAHWRLGQRPEGKKFAGTSLHEPATQENAAALRQLRPLGFHTCFLDDDFRLARGPGEIGGCFCDAHRTEFLQHSGFATERWEELKQDVAARRFTPLLRAWVEFTCDQLTASFRAQRRAFGGDLGPMVMYLGAEKAGLRLADYRNAPFRVGELMFDDRSFAPVKGKTDELFSVLFHRRFARPDRAYSESTAFPADRLSGANMAAKLAISTLADVRHTMFMSGLTPFPRDHWRVLAPAMRAQARLHEAIAGHRPRGPFKHFWGEAQRYVGDDKPFSLWLAAGVPFEVVEDLPADGWTFLSDFDARAVSGRKAGAAGKLVGRDTANVHPSGSERLAESLPALFEFKRRLKPQLQNVPHVAEDEPAVCAWYPTAQKVLVWNLGAQTKRLTVVAGERRLPLSLGPLEAGLAPTDARPRTATSS